MKKQKSNCVKERFKEINATPEYQAKNDIARHAILELSKVDEISIVTKEQCLVWLSRYKFFYKNFKGRGPLFYPTLWDFYCLYSDVKRYIDYFSLNEQQISNALKELQTINLESEKSLQKWLITYKTLSDDLPYFEKAINDNYIYISQNLNIITSSVDFSLAINFRNEFTKYTTINSKNLIF